MVIMSYFTPFWLRKVSKEHSTFGLGGWGELIIFKTVARILREENV